MNLVVIPFHDWKKCEREGFRTRDGHFMQEFASHPEIEKMLVINRPISVAEMALMRRNWRPKHGTTVFQEGSVCVSQVSGNTYVLDIRIPEFLKPLRMKREWTPYIFGQPSVLAAVEAALAHLGIESDFALFMSAPLFTPLVEQLTPSEFAFDAQDNLLKHASYRAIPNLETYYQYCLDHADFISANAPETTRWFKEHRSDAIHISNGVDETMFNPDQPHLRPQDMESISGPVVGYAGKMQEMFDISLMTKVVSQLPHVNFVFIGQELNRRWMKPLWRYPNAFYLGDKPYVNLPQYLAAFDVCIIPYDQNRQHGVDPIKFYEYLAMGKPVVTTDVGAVSALEDYPQVRVVRTADAFVDGVRYFTDLVNENALTPRSSLPQEYSWRAKADKIVRAILEKQGI